MDFEKVSPLILKASPVLVSSVRNGPGDWIFIKGQQKITGVTDEQKLKRRLKPEKWELPEKSTLTTSKAWHEIVWACYWLDKSAIQMWGFSSSLMEVYHSFILPDRINFSSVSHLQKLIFQKNRCLKPDARLIFRTTWFFDHHPSSFIPPFSSILIIILT